MRLNRHEAELCLEGFNSLVIKKLEEYIEDITLEVNIEPPTSLPDIFAREQEFGKVRAARELLIGFREEINRKLNEEYEQ